MKNEPLEAERKIVTLLTKNTIKTTRRLACVEIKHEKADIVLTNRETGQPLGRPWITVATDTSTRSILGSHIGFNPPTHLSVMLCLIHCTTPKKNIKQDYPYINHTWDAYGIPKVLVVDRRKEFRSRRLHDLCRRLGISIQYVPAPIATHITRNGDVCAAFNEDLTGLQASTASSRTIDTERPDKTTSAEIDLPAFQGLFYKWIIDIYHQRYQRGMNDTPAQAWAKAAKARARLLPHHKKRSTAVLRRFPRRREGKWHDRPRDRRYGNE